ncbi:hypothetical protein [Helicobacter sp. 23-1045]
MSFKWAICLWVCDSHEVCRPCVVDEPLVLSPSKATNFVQSHTANTSIEILRIAESNKQNGENIADSAFLRDSQNLF